MIRHATLHYIYDPFCGWCYAAAPLLTAATEIDGLKVVAHGGGMLTGTNVKKMTAEWRDFVRPHEQRIAALSGQSFGTAYRDGTQFNYDVVLDSGPPTAGMLAAEEVFGAGLAMLKRLQVAYYVEGQPIAEERVILDLSSELGLELNQFSKALEHARKQLVEHFYSTQKLLARVGGRGFPTFAVEQNNEIVNLHLGHFLGKPQEFRLELERMVAVAN
jgi:putative protein-disulfide isomerase